MGKRRDRTKWSPVNLIEEPQAAKQGAVSSLERRTSSYSQTNDPRTYRRNQSSVVAPRFAKSQGQDPPGGEVTVEELPDGYTKIRSKNLDVIFKKDFYQRKMDQGIVSLAVQGHSAPAEKVSFEELDLDVIQEFRPRQGTGVESINDSGYSTSLSNSFQDASFMQQDQFQGPHQQQGTFPSGPCPGQFVPTIPMSVPPPIGQTPSQFYLYSPATNTLIPCEEILVGQTITSAEGDVYQGTSKAYVAYPVHGPEGSGYITQPFVSPNYGSGSEDRSPKPEAKKNQEHKQGQEGITSSFHATKERNDVRRKTVSLSSTMPRPCLEQEDNPQVQLSRAEPVYIPGLVTSPTVKKVKKRRKKKPKTKNEGSKMNISSSDSECKEHALGQDCNPMKAFEEEMFSFTEEPPINEINLTDDLANSLLNPPTEDDDMENTIARDILNIVQTEAEEESVPLDMDMTIQVSGQGNSFNVNEVQDDESSKVEETYLNFENETKPIDESGKLLEETKFVTKTKKKKPKKQSKHLESRSAPQSPADLEIQIDETSNLKIEEEDVPPPEQSAPETSNLVKEVKETCPSDAESPIKNSNEGVIVPKDDNFAVDNNTANENPVGEEAKEDEIYKEAGSKAVVTEEESNKENNPGRRRRKRGAKDKGGKINQPLQRVLVVDDQVDIRYRPTSTLDPSKAEISHIDDISPYKSYADIYVKDLGLGMLRGVMELGRPFHGYYRPPDRREYELVEEEEGEQVGGD